MARLLIDQLSAEWDPTEHPNEYRQTLRRLLASKRKVVVEKSHRAENVVDLMEVLKRSVQTTRRRGAKAAPRKTGTSHRKAETA